MKSEYRLLDSSHEWLIDLNLDSNDQMFAATDKIILKYHVTKFHQYLS